MNRKIGMVGAGLNALSVAVFAIALGFDIPFLGYSSSIFIALSFVLMVSAFSNKCAAGNAAMIFAAIYATFIILIYFTQLTTLRNEALSLEMARLLNYSAFSWFFNLNLMGYGLMSLSGFFASLTIKVRTKSHKILKYMLMGHGIFFISGFIMPILGIFTDMDGADIIGTIVLLVWCAIFLPIGILSYLYFRDGGEDTI
ncbi:MAG: hypothetical protein FWC67_00220 [Defluviitaleaceae bacterium]|nr:hypothetical protein [Defluviitaleaceae bacterium]